MRNFYFLRSKRVDGRIEVYPLTNQHTISSESGHSRDVVDVDITRRIQASNDARHLYVGCPVGTVFVTVCEGNTPFASRLPVYSRGDEKVYRIDNIRKIDDLDRNNEDDAPVVARLLSYCLSLDVDALRENGLTNWYASNRTEAEFAPAPAPAPAAAAIPMSETQAANAYGVDRHPLVSLKKMKAIADHFSSLGNNAVAVNQKTLLLSELNDMMHNGVVKFVFRKQNGDMRTAFGTLVHSAIAHFGNLGSQTEHPDSDLPDDGAHFYYFDIQKRGWRNFCTEDFRSFERADSFFVGESVSEAQRSQLETIAASAVETA